MPTWVREKALLAMTSPLGQDVLIPLELTANERIGEPFDFDVLAVSQQGIVDPNQLLHQPVCVIVQSEGNPVRYFSGIVRHLNTEGYVRGQSDAGSFQIYRLSLVPKFWFLHQTVDCRVFQNMTVVDVLTQMFNDMGISGTTFPAPGAQREYIVQFNESDFAFATRLMEEEGYFYFFQHTASDHPMTIANQNGAFIDIAGATLKVGADEHESSTLIEFEEAARTVRGQMKFKDYDPVNPDTLLQNVQPTTLKAGGTAMRDDFRWPVLTFDNGTVTDRTKREMEAAEAIAALYQGSSRFGPLFAGGKFTIASEPASPYDGSYVLRATTHRASDQSWINNQSAPSYFNRITAFKSDVTWRQPMVTPRPRMDGVHTALVLGPQHGKEAEIKSQSGEEIHTDDLARVKVRFYWDHRAEATGDASCWARVIMPWAGNGWGAQFIPRVGTEVAIAFVDGDPDRPIVLGGLYNGRDAPIYTKADKTKTGFRTRSSLKGGKAEFNELTFDDKKGDELVYMQAQKDLSTYVKHDQTLKVDNCRMVTVGQDETVSIGNNQTIKVKMDHKLTVTDGNHFIAVSKGDAKFHVDMGNHDVKIAMGNQSTDVSMGNQSTKIGMGNLSTDVSMGNVNLKAGLGAITDEAMQGITLKVGSSSIKIDQMGVTIEGMMIKINGQVQTQIQGLMTQVSGSAMLQLSGGITMIG